MSDTPVAVSSGPVRNFNRKLAAASNLMRRPGLTGAVKGPGGNNAGGKGFTAFFNDMFGDQQEDIVERWRVHVAEYPGRYE